MSSSLLRGYERHFLWWDTLLPLGVGVGLVLGLKAWVGDEGAQTSIEDNRAVVYGALAGVGGSLLGFAITLVPLMHALLSLEGLKLLRENERSGDLFKALIHAVGALAVMTVGALSALVLDRDAETRVVVQYIVLVLLVLAAWKLFTAVRVMWVMLDLALRSHRA